jgi:hypothetical protein
MEEESHILEQILSHQERILTNQGRIEEKLDLFSKQEKDSSFSEKKEEMIDLTEIYMSQAKF